ncbi:MAG: hypothetical protein K2V38_23665, partial [Gemmataceae bacterium]|nr:hypothetical protein [Gemmataceae bacterium]
MIRRSPILSLSFAAMVGLFALTSALTAQPVTQPATQPATQPVGPTTSGTKRTQEENLKFYKSFADQVLRLAQRWEKSDSVEDRDRAKTLRAALKLAEEKGVEKLFKDLIEGLNGKDLGGSEFDTLLGKDKSLITALREILDILERDESGDLARQIKELEEAIKRIRELKTQQENLMARTTGKGDPDKLAKDQKDLKEATGAIARALAKAANAGNDPKGGNAKEDPKSENKAEAKPGENAAENKPDTKENKANDKGDGMGGMGQPMDPKGAGEGKPMGGDGMGMPGDKGDKPAGMDMMGGDAKGGEPKPMGGPMDPKDPKGGEPKAGEGKPQGAGKGEGKPSDGQPGGDAKPMDGGMGGMG